MSTSIRVGACQTPEILGNIGAAIECINSFAGDAKAKQVDLLLFPECFLQGYLVEEKHLRQHALDLQSSAFKSVLSQLASIGPTLVFGVIELEAGKLYNTAVVVKDGNLIGAYRKTHLVPGEALFEPGTSYPVFEWNGIKYGINICYDTQFADAAEALAAQGAQLLLVPAQNMMKQVIANEWQLKHNKIRAERVKETGMWLVSADVTGRRDSTRVGYGPTSVMNPKAEVIAQVPLMTAGMAVAKIG